MSMRADLYTIIFNCGLPKKESLKLLIDVFDTLGWDVEEEEERLRKIETESLTDKQKALILRILSDEDTRDKEISFYLGREKKLEQLTKYEGTIVISKIINELNRQRETDCICQWGWDNGE